MSLKHFLRTKMRMSHIYQPVMIRTLLENQGEASRKDIARALLSYDDSQVEYYEKIVDNMVGRVLRNHEIVSREKKTYQLQAFHELSESEVAELIEICNHKIREFIEKRNDIWLHRRKNRKPVPGSVRYKVLQRAHGRCELCGISKDEKALEVDHITPKNVGGKDDISNYQALCYTCNANKRDTDDTDFRNQNKVYDSREKDCLFCQESDMISENHLALARLDKYPVTVGHTLIIPKRHVQSYTDLFQAEINAIHDLIKKRKSELLQSDSTISGFNLGINEGISAGQTIMHCHVHLIPRRNGDHKDPTGGIRAVIPGKANYRES